MAQRLALYIYVAPSKMSNELHNDSDAKAISPPMVCRM
jgi:hypothetical protein